MLALILLWSLFLALIMFLVGTYIGGRAFGSVLQKDCDNLGMFRTDKAVYGAYKIKDIDKPKSK